ncbi:MAG: hypothetical protein GY807_18375 [Gammaproteobacteria bacterium]|nr:hypothetical protein [Gammaproteobacteria bacterium]
MDLSVLLLTGGVLAGLIYGLWGVRLVVDRGYAQRVGNAVRKMWGAKNTGEIDEVIFDRLSRGLPAVIIGFTIAIVCLRAVLISTGII